MSLPGSGRPTLYVCLIPALFAFFLQDLAYQGLLRGYRLQEGPSLRCLICLRCQNTPMIRKLLVCFLFHLVLWNFKWNHILRQLGCLLSRTGRKGHFPFIASRNFFCNVLIPNIKLVKSFYLMKSKQKKRKFQLQLIQSHRSKNIFVVKI